MPTHRVVLVVDDEEMIRRLLADVLDEEPGLHAVCVADGAQALAACEQAVPAVALVDVNLPGMSGLEVIRRLKSNPRTARVPLIAFSAGQNREAAVEAGCDEFVDKPFDLDDLVGRIRRHTPEET